MDGAQVGLLGHSKAPKRSLNLLRDEPRPLRHTPSTLTCNMSRRMFLGCRKRSLKQNRTIRRFRFERRYLRLQAQQRGKLPVWYRLHSVITAYEDSYSKTKHFESCWLRKPQNVSEMKVTQKETHLWVTYTASGQHQHQPYPHCSKTFVAFFFTSAKAFSIETLIARNRQTLKS